MGAIILYLKTNCEHTLRAHYSDYERSNLRTVMSPGLLTPGADSILSPPPHIVPKHLVIISFGILIVEFTAFLIGLILHCLPPLTIYLYPLAPLS